VVNFLPKIRVEVAVKDDQADRGAPWVRRFAKARFAPAAARRPSRRSPPHPLPGFGPSSSARPVSTPGVPASQSRTQTRRSIRWLSGSIQRACQTSLLSLRWWSPSVNRRQQASSATVTCVAAPKAETCQFAFGHSSVLSDPRPEVSQRPEQSEGIRCLPDISEGNPGDAQMEPTSAIGP
jgi:hypothetical protein